MFCGARGDLSLRLGIVTSGLGNPLSQATRPSPHLSRRSVHAAQTRRRGLPAGGPPMSRVGETGSGAPSGGPDKGIVTLGKKHQHTQKNVS